MTFAPLGHTPYPWYNGPSGGTAVNATNLMAAEDDLIAYAQQDDLEVVSYFEGGGSAFGPPASVVRDSSQSGGTSDAWVYASKYLALVGSTYATATAAVQAAHDDLPSTGGAIVLPPTTLTLDNLSITKHMVFQGVYRQTILLPGASGTIMTVNQTGSGQGGAFALRDIHLGEVQGQTSPNRSYATPMILFEEFSSFLDLTGFSAMVQGTGTIFRFSSSGNLTIRSGFIISGAYAIPFEFDDVASPSFFADTITIDSTIVSGMYFAIFRNGANASTPLYSNVDLKGKVVGTVNGVQQNTIDDSLDYTVGFGEIAAGATQIQVSNSGWAIDDGVYIEGDYATDGTTRTGGTAETNRVTAVSGSGPYVLTLAEPVRFNHGTNAGAFHVQVLRGGVGITLSNDTAAIHGHDFHFEDLQFAVMDCGSQGSKWDCCTKITDSFIRIVGATQDLEVGLLSCNGRSTSNRVLDLPSWSGTGSERFRLMGPWLLTTPKVNDSGTDYTLDAMAGGTILATKSYVTRDTALGYPRDSYHLPTGQGSIVRSRWSVGTATDNIDLEAGGQAIIPGLTSNKTTLTYSTTVTPNGTAGLWQTVTVTNSTAFTMAAVSGTLTASQTRRIVIEVFNNSGGSMGTITWNGAFVFNGFTWANPATGKRRFAVFEWNGTEWVCTSLAGADY